MVKKPIYNFDNGTSKGLDLVPVNGTILIESMSKMILLIDKAGVDGATTIDDLLALPAQWKPIEQGGVAWQLGTVYVIGDIVAESEYIYTCVSIHTSLTGDVADGSPTQPSQTNWKENVVNHDQKLYFYGGL